MSFNVSKAILYGVTMAIAVGIGQLISNTWSREITLIAAAAAGVIGAVVFGFMMREVSLDIAGATPASVDAATKSAWALKSFKGSETGTGEVRYQRGVGFLGDIFMVTPIATGVRLTGPSSILNVVKKKAAGR